MYEIDYLTLSGQHSTSTHTLLHSRRQLKQNWCIHESVKHLFFTELRQMEQFGGDWLSFCRCSSSLVEVSSGFGTSARDAFSSRAGDRRCCDFRNSRMRRFDGGVAGNSAWPSGVGGHSVSVSAIVQFGYCYLSFTPMRKIVYIYIYIFGYIFGNVDFTLVKPRRCLYQEAHSWWFINNNQHRKNR